MSEAPRLCALAGVRPGVALPGYRPGDHAPGIVHLGIGAFHRAHQAVYTDAALAAEGGDWRITGASLRGTAAAEALNPQNGLYTVLERGADGTSAAIIGSVAGVVTAAADAGAVLSAMAAPQTRIVSLTVTEKAYGIDRAGGMDAAHPVVAADLAEPRRPSGVLGHLVEALRRRREAGLPAFTVLCCDNLPDNGRLLGAAVLDFAARLEPALARWIAAEASFPSTMVDRITPAPTAATIDDAQALTGFRDLAAVETEPFSQWVIEDRFVLGRPKWQAGGALFVPDVAPYERMKLRMLNGTHSTLAYCGFLSGLPHVRDVMRDPDLAKLVDRHLRAAAATLAPLPGIDLSRYADDLKARFANPAIAHETWQIAMDGTEKLPQRIIAPAAGVLAEGGDIRPFAFTVAAWMRYCLGQTDEGRAYALRDPRENAIAAAMAGARDAQSISAALHALPGLFPQALASDAGWRGTVAEILQDMLDHGMAGAVAAEARRG